VHADNGRRAIAFGRSHGAEEFLVVGSLNNQVLDECALQHGSLGTAAWREVFNSDDARYGGEGGTSAEPVQSKDGRLTLRVPARAVVVLRRSAG